MPARHQDDDRDREGPLIAARHHRRLGGGHAGQLTVTVVPAPGRLAIAARPPAATIRPGIDSRVPRRRGGGAGGADPRARRPRRRPATTPRVSDSRIPRREAGVAAGSNPRPRSVILTTAQPAPPVTLTSARPVPACRSTFRSASPTQATS